MNHHVRPYIMSFCRFIIYFGAFVVVAMCFVSGLFPFGSCPFCCGGYRILNS